MSKAFWFEPDDTGFREMLTSMADGPVAAEARRIASSAASAGIETSVEARPGRTRCAYRVSVEAEPGPMFEWKSRPDGSHYLSPRFSGNPLSKFV